GALETFAHVLGNALAREFQIGQRHIGLPAANELRDKVELLRRYAQIARFGLRFAVPERTGCFRFAHSILTATAWTSCPRHGHGMSASARIRRTCDPPSPRTPAPEYASGRYGRRMSAPRTGAGSWSGGS